MQYWLIVPSYVEAQGLTLPPYVRLIVSGVGALSSLHTLWKTWESSIPPRAIFSIGLAGSYKPYLELGAMVFVREEIWGDLGKRKGRQFLPSPSYLLQGQKVRWTAEVELPSFLDLPQVRGLTLHTVSGSLREAQFWRRAYPDADIETQENAAFFLFAEEKSLPLYSFRVISNYVGYRYWAKELALQQLRTFTQTHVVRLCERLLESHRASP
ncbi:MAG: hypothetical protein RMJ66_07920 [Bacteroidia bacterium]|nr:hypothetical protein [Bacteroidia bacterium]